MRAGIRSHGATFLRTLPAGFQACLAVIHLVFGALILATFADFHAGATDGRHHLAVPCHVCGRKPADFRAVYVYRNAVGHRMHIGFMQARAGTTVTSNSAGVTRGDTGLILGILHGRLPQIEGEALPEQTGLPGRRAMLAITQPQALALNPACFSGEGELSFSQIRVSLPYSSTIGLYRRRVIAMTTGKLDFGDLVENVGVAKLSDIVVGAGYVGAVIATLPLEQRTMISYMLVDVLGEEDERLSCMSRFVVELVANAISNKEFTGWALHEVDNMVN
jgi:hypothetical protein